MQTKIFVIITIGAFFFANINAQMVGTPYIVPTVPSAPAATAAMIFQPDMCLVCGASGSIMSHSASGVTNPLFYWYDSQTSTTPIAVGSSYSVAKADLGIDLPNKIQGGYKYFYLSVEGGNYSQNADGTRKEILVKGAALPMFADYNLGADPQYNTPKKQMQYLANNHRGIADGRVFCGRYQWGRSATDYAINPSNYTLYNGGCATSNPGQCYRTPALAVWQLDGNGQPTVANDSRIVTYRDRNNQGNSLVDYDWMETHDNALLGNGAYMSLAAQSGGSRNTDGYLYQSPVGIMPQNNPAPKGWRVPTQDELERLGNYDCDATTAATLNITSAASAFDTGRGLTWVRVKNGKAYAGDLQDGDRAGFAIYYIKDWNAAAASYKNGSDYLYAAAAPDIVLFLPNAGCRQSVDGTAYYSGVYSRYHTSTVAGGAKIIAVGSNGAGAQYIMFNSETYRAYGFPIRCVVD